MALFRPGAAALALLFGAGIAGADPGTISLTQPQWTFTESYGYGWSVTVYRHGGSTGTVSADFTIGGGTATQGSDYESYNGTLTWYHGETFGQNISIAARNDAEAEPTESFNVTLSNPTGGADLGTASAVVSIRDDDGPGVGTIRFVRSPFVVAEWSGLSEITLERVDGKGGEVSATVVSADGTAHEGSDYAGVLETLTWADGQSGLKSFYLGTTSDDGDEPDETLQLSISASTGGVATEGPATVIITDGGDESEGRFGSGGGGALSSGLLLLAVAGAAARRRRR